MSCSMLFSNHLNWNLFKIYWILNADKVLYQQLLLKEEVVLPVCPMTHFILKTLHQENDSDFLNIIEIDLLTLLALIKWVIWG